MKKSINHAIGLCAVAIVSSLLVLGSPAQATADSRGGGSGKHVTPATAATGHPGKPRSAATVHPGKPGSADHSRGNAATSGDVSSPQPLSHADHNTGGANGKCPGGPYCSTRDGSPSMNGNGGGQATGKPCAGCVGKADNKNPRGQYPNGSDHNAGYECDRNHGIGRSNPAHTGCTASSTPPSGCVENPETPGPDCGSTPPSGCVENPVTPGPDCGSTPVPGCRENPATPGPDCGSTPPSACLENPATPGPDCSTVVPPSGCAATSGCQTVSPPLSTGGSAEAVTAAAAPASVEAGVLPETGSPAGMVAQLLASLALLAGGALVLARRRRA